MLGAIPKRVLMAGIVLAVSVLLSLLLCEAGLRLFFPQNLALWYKTRDDLTIHRPGHQGVFRGIETEQPYRMNSFGMRDNPHVLEKQNGVFRILLLGDSFMEALQVPSEQSFPRLLESELQRTAGHPVELINASVAGWGTDEELTYLVRYGMAFHPDLILIGMTLHNDVYDNLEQNYHTINENQLVQKHLKIIGFGSYAFWQFKAYLGAHSHLYQLFRMWWHSEEMQVQGKELSDQVAQLLKKHSSGSIEKGWALTFALFEEMRLVGKNRDIDCVVFLIPLAMQMDRDRLSKFLVDRGLTDEEVDPERPQRLMKEFGEKERIQVIDLLPSFKDWTARSAAKLYLQQDGHWTEEGHKLASRLVAEALIPRVALSNAGVR